MDLPFQFPFITLRVPPLYGPETVLEWLLSPGVESQKYLTPPSF